MPTAPQYQYVNTQGVMKTVADKSLATDIAKNSGFATVMPPVNTMPAESLGQNTKTYSTYTPPATGYTGVAESAIAAKDAVIASAAKEAAALEADQVKGRGKIMDIFKNLGGAATRKADAYESSGLNADRKAIDELNSQIEGRSRAYDKQIQVLTENNPEGKLASGVENEMNRLNRAKASELADLSIVLNAKTRNYDTAKSIIDQKADAETEDLRTKLEGMRFFYSENAGMLDEKKRLVLSDKIDAAEREYAAAKELRTNIGDLQLAAAKGGAPVSVVRSIGAATDIAAATALAAAYTKGSGNGFDMYTDEDKRTIYQANLANASDQTKAVFLNTPPEFRQAFIRNGGAREGVPTPENIIKSLAEWETYQKSQKNGDEDLNAAIKLLQSSPSGG